MNQTSFTILMNFMN